MNTVKLLPIRFTGCLKFRGTFHGPDKAPNDGSACDGLAAMRSALRYASLFKSGDWHIFPQYVSIGYGARTRWNFFLNKLRLHMRRILNNFAATCFQL